MAIGIESTWPAIGNDSGIEGYTLEGRGGATTSLVVSDPNTNSERERERKREIEREERYFS